MKKILILITLIIAISGVSCTNTSVSELTQKCDSLLILNSQLQQRITGLSDSLILLSYPASDRLNRVKTLIAENKLDEATSEIIELKILFPHSKENAESSIQESIIANKIAKVKEKEARIKAMGYKVFADNSTINLENRKLNFSGFTFGRTFTFDYCSDIGEYYYRTADKDNTYVLASMSMTSTEKGYVSTPSIGVYRIENGSLKKIAIFQEEYATYSSYGAKIGNYSDDTHDFSKVNTVHYKIAAEIGREYTSLPTIILTGKNGESQPDSLSIEDVKDRCLVIKMINRNKL